MDVAYPEWIGRNIDLREDNQVCSIPGRFSDQANSLLYRLRCIEEDRCNVAGCILSVMIPNLATRVRGVVVDVPATLTFGNHEVIVGFLHTLNGRSLTLQTMFL